MQHVVEVQQIALRQRLVEPVVVLEGRDRGGVARSLLAEVRGDRIRRHELGQHEGHRGDTDQQQDERRQPAGGEADQSVRSAEAAQAPAGDL